MNMSSQDFWKMRPGVFFLKLHYFNMREEKRERMQAELVRIQTAKIANILCSNKIKDITKFWPMSWDEEEKTNLRDETDNWTYEQRVEAAKKLVEQQNQRINGIES